MKVSRKLEIKQIVEVAGLSEQQKPSLIDGAFLMTKRTKPECLLNKSLLAVIIVVLDVVEDGTTWLGTIS